ncbi:hypothetical protein GCM10017559_02730 [Streptosporangium longisporum]|uniref:Uncharacterized protein n=1 Tax=Streptosporangium longisporum TaxID=46187 RepID=A0ABP6K6J0_9ACTN
MSGRLYPYHPVGPECPPLVPGHVSGDEVPAAACVHQAVGVDVSDGGLSRMVAVGKPGALAMAAGGGQFQQHAGRDLRFLGSGGVDEGGVHLRQPVCDPGRQDLL